jgi:glutamate racemase
MRIALINSGIGLLAAAAELHRLRPDADLVLAMDPDGMPWGPRTPDDIAQRSLAAARAAAALRPDVLVFACNTGTVHALGALRAEFEPGIPVVGTVPAIKPAAAASDSVAIWATVATTASAYQRRLIADFAGSARVTAVACPGLADAVHAGDEPGIRAAVAGAAGRTPAGCGAVVLGCTEYELAAGLIGAALPGTALFRSAPAVAAQALRRAGAASGPGAGPRGAAHPAGAASGPGAASAGAARPAGAASGPGAGPAGAADPAGTVRVILSGRPAPGLPEAALRYAEGRLLAGLVADGRPGDLRADGGWPGDRWPGDAGRPGDDFRPGDEDFRPGDCADPRSADDRPVDERPPDERPADDRADDLRGDAAAAGGRRMPPNSVLA